VWVEREEEGSKENLAAYGVPAHLWLDDGRLLTWVLAKEGYGRGRSNGYKYEAEIAAADADAQAARRVCGRLQRPQRRQPCRRPPRQPCLCEVHLRSNRDRVGAGDLLLWREQHAAGGGPPPVELLNRDRYHLPQRLRPIAGHGTISCRILVRDQEISSATSQGAYVIASCAEGG